LIQDKKFFGVTKGTVQGIQMARKLDVKTIFGTDLIFNPVAAKNMATAANAKLVKICDSRHTYPGTSIPSVTSAPWGSA
jgi:hypothetical protein